MNFGFLSVFLSQRSCRGAGLISELGLSLAQCFISLSPLRSAQEPSLMMLSFVLVWAFFLAWGVGGRGGCVVGTRLVAHEGAAALRLPCKLVSLYTVTTLHLSVRSVMQKWMTSLKHHCILSSSLFMCVHSCIFKIKDCWKHFKSDFSTLFSWILSFYSPIYIAASFTAVYFSLYVSNRLQK